MTIRKCTEIIFFAAVLVEGAAHAQNAEATALFKAGRELVEQGQWPEACPKFDAAFQLDSNARGTLQNLADCHEHVGQIARAWAEWNMLGDLARKAQDDPRTEESKKHVDALEPRLPKLRVSVAGSQSDLSVWRDDKELKVPEYNLELPIDPGSHTITVRRGAEKLASQNVDMKEKGHDSASFDLDKIAKDHPAPVEAAGTNGGGKVVQTNTVVVNGGGEAKSASGGKVVANIFLGLGLTAVVFGGAFIGVGGALSTSKSKCTELATPANTWACTGANADNVNIASTLASVGQWVAIGGAVFAATAIVLYVVLPKDKEKPAAQVSFTPTSGGGTLSFGGVF